MCPTLSIAIVGADGAGKSTVIRELLKESPNLRYLYLGASIDSANYSLPTSRWLMRRTRRALGSALGDSAAVPPAAILPREMKAKLRRGRVLKVLGLVNRVAEEWYRWLVLAYFRATGHTVLCDRHFLFDYCPDSPLVRAETITERIHHWQLSRLYPKPDLVMFLDAPPEVLYRRKQEWNVDYLRRQREMILQQGRLMRHFVSIDATRPVESVVGDVRDLIARRQAAG
jgi:thymidylate kinase